MATASSRTAPRKAASRAPAKTAAVKAAPTKKRAAVARKAPVKAPAKPVAAKAGAAPKHKHKLVRDSFTMPQQDFDLVAVLKKRAIGLGRPAKKSELLRAGLHALARLDDTSLKAVLAGLVELKAGRPRKER